MEKKQPSFSDLTIKTRKIPELCRQLARPARKVIRTLQRTAVNILSKLGNRKKVLSLGWWLCALYPMQAQTVNTTTVQGVIYRADGSPASGVLTIAWPAFSTSLDQAVAAGTVTVPIGADGYVAVNLAPNVGAAPVGSYYTAMYHLGDGTLDREYWVVPVTPTASISSVRARLAPSDVAQRTVSKEYVDKAMASVGAAGGPYVPVSGGTMVGPLLLPGDPASAMQAVSKQYADLLALSALSLSGGVMTGPLLLNGNPTLPLAAATKQYVDSHAAGSSTTAINLAGGSVNAVPYQPAAGATSFIPGATADGSYVLGETTADGKSGIPAFISTPKFASTNGVVNASSATYSGTDIASQFNAAKASLPTDSNGAPYGSIDLDPSVTYTIAGPFRLNTGSSLDCHFAQIIYTPAAGYAVVVGDPFTPSGQLTLIKNCRFVAQGGYVAGNSNGCIYQGGDPASSTRGYNGRQLRIENTYCTGFKYGFSFGNNAYMTTLSNVWLRFNYDGIYSPPSNANSGERMIVEDSVISGNSNLGIELSNPDIKWHVDNTSFDFNGAAIGGSGCAIDLFDSHLEQNTGPLVTCISGSGLQFNMQGGNIGIDNSGGSGDALFQIHGSNAQPSSIAINNTYDNFAQSIADWVDVGSSTANTICLWGNITLSSSPHPSPAAVATAAYRACTGGPSQAVGGTAQLSQAPIAATAVPGANIASAACLAGLTCTDRRGSVVIVGGRTEATGVIATLSWPAITSAYVCTAMLNGGPFSLGIGNSVATPTGFSITAASPVRAITFIVNYSCQP